MLIADKYKWLYCHDKDRKKCAKFAKAFPEIFKVGDGRQYIRNQFWGKVKNGKINFWRGNFYYHTERANDLNEHLVYAFQMPELSSQDFVLESKNMINKVKKYSSDLTTESIEFNKLFQIKYKGKLEEIGAKIFEVLNPLAMEKLINFRKYCGPFKLMFRGNTMIVEFNNMGVADTHYTNFFIEIALDKRDEEIVSKSINSTIELAESIISKIN